MGILTTPFQLLKAVYFLGILIVLEHVPGIFVAIQPLPQSGDSRTTAFFLCQLVKRISKQEVGQ